MGGMGNVGKFNFFSQIFFGPGISYKYLTFHLTFSYCSLVEKSDLHAVDCVRQIQAPNQPTGVVTPDPGSVGSDKCVANQNQSHFGLCQV